MSECPYKYQSNKERWYKGYKSGVEDTINKFVYMCRQFMSVRKDSHTAICTMDDIERIAKYISAEIEKCDKPDIHDDFYLTHEFPNGYTVEFKQGFYMYVNGEWNQV